jgi:predicted  nucleic acid-binding Zn-ribbon protein
MPRRAHDINHILSILFTAAVGAAAGFSAGLLTDSIKNSVAAVRSELERLDGLLDDTLDVIEAIERLQALTTELRKLSRDRGRLGTNLTRLYRRNGEWSRINDSLVMLSRVIGEVADLADAQSKDGDSHSELNADLARLREAVEDRVQGLRVAILSAAEKSLEWQIAGRRRL